MSARRRRKMIRDVAAPASRPLRLATEANIAQRFIAALGTSDGAAGAHCIHELWMRGEIPARIETAQQKLWDHCAASIPEWMPTRYISWLSTAYDVAGTFVSTGHGRSNLYLVLLDNSERRGDAFGVYVGMSRYAPAQRFDQHKAGIRAAGCVLKRGLEVLTGPVLHLQTVKRLDAQRIEKELAGALADAGLAVEGGH